MSVSLRVVLGLLAVSLFALGVTGNALYSQLVYLWVFLLAGSWLWARLALRGLQVQRGTRLQRSQVGQIFGERFNIHNTSRFPILWLEVEDQSDLPGSRGSRVFTRIGGRQSQFYLSRTRLFNRGIFPLGPTKLLAGDVFGFFQISLTLPVQKSLLVYPYMVDVHTFPNPPGLLPGGEALRQKAPQVTSNAAGVRDYAPGDALNRIHWASTARRDRLIVKEFELDPRADVWVFCDSFQDVQTALPYTAPLDIGSLLVEPTGKTALPPSTEEYVVSVAASLAKYYIMRGRAVGFISHGQSLHLLPPDRGPRQLGKILEALSLLDAVGNVPFDALVSAHARNLPRGSVVVLITSSTDPEIAVSVDHIVRMNLRPVIILLDAASFGGASGSKKLSDTIRSLGVPVGLVPFGADLGEVLGAVVSC